MIRSGKHHRLAQHSEHRVLALNRRYSEADAENPTRQNEHDVKRHGKKGSAFDFERPGGPADLESKCQTTAKIGTSSRDHILANGDRLTHLSTQGYLPGVNRQWLTLTRRPNRLQKNNRVSVRVVS